MKDMVSVEVKCSVPLENIFLCQHFSKAEMELKRKQEEEDRKKRAEEEKVMQVWNHTRCSLPFLELLHSLFLKGGCLKERPSTALCPPTCRLINFISNDNHI